MSSKSLIISITFFINGIFLADLSAAVVAIAAQEGSDVIFRFSGSILTTNLKPLAVTPSTIRAGISPQTGGIGFGSVLGDDSARYLLFVASLGPFGTGVGGFADSASGDIFGLVNNSRSAELVLPKSYLSGSTISGSMTFSNHTFQTLGLSPGTYEITWPVDTQIDRFTLVVVPEVSSTCLVLLSGVSMLLLRNR